MEDSKNSVLASKAAGMKTNVTTSGFNVKEDVSAGDVIVTCLNVPGGEKTKMTKGNLSGFDGVVYVKQKVELFGK